MGWPVLRPLELAAGGRCQVRQPPPRNRAACAAASHPGHTGRTAGRARSLAGAPGSRRSPGQQQARRGWVLRAKKSEDGTPDEKPDERPDEKPVPRRRRVPVPVQVDPLLVAADTNAYVYDDFEGPSPEERDEIIYSELPVWDPEKGSLFNRCAAGGRPPPPPSAPPQHAGAPQTGGSPTLALARRRVEKEFQEEVQSPTISPEETAYWFTIPPGGCLPAAGLAGRCQQPRRRRRRWPFLPTPQTPPD